MDNDVNPRTESALARVLECKELKGMTGADKQQIKTTVLRWHAQQLEEDSVRWKSLLKQATKSAEHERKMALRVYAAVQRIDDMIKARLPESFVVQHESADDTRLERVAKMEMNVEALVDQLKRYDDDHNDCLVVLNKIDGEKTKKSARDSIKLADVIRDRVDGLVLSFRRATTAKNHVTAENEVLREALNLKSTQRRDSKEKALKNSAQASRPSSWKRGGQTSEDATDNNYRRQSLTTMNEKERFQNASRSDDFSASRETSRVRQIERVKPIVNRNQNSSEYVNDDSEIYETHESNFNTRRKLESVTVSPRKESRFHPQQQQYEYDKYSNSRRNNATRNQYYDNERKFNDRTPDFPQLSNNSKKPFRLPAITRTDTTKPHEPASRSVNFLEGQIMKFANRLHQAQYEMDSCQKELKRMQAAAFTQDEKILDRRHDTIYRFRNPATVSMIRFPQLDLSENTNGGLEGGEETGRSVRSEFHFDKRRKLRKV